MITAEMQKKADVLSAPFPPKADPPPAGKVRGAAFFCVSFLIVAHPFPPEADPPLFLAEGCEGQVQ